MSSIKDQKKTIKINEIFYDIEGEGKYQGYPTLFIRVTGCNLRCKWCDTKYAYFNGKNISIKKIISIIKKSPYKNVNITGGEPLLYKKTINLITKKIKNKIITIETNGSISIKGIKADNISMDLKLPSSGESDKMILSNLKLLRPKDQLKLVIGSYEDMIYANKILKKYKVKSTIIAQPVYKKFKLINIKNFVLKNKLNWKVSIQMHKMFEKDV
ncbi:MAG: radical SAM protein [Candidatus Goldbacteria bacterium]|nr:radical SAM protein [Candidatus Goldiibacteriota bacterium]